MIFCAIPTHSISSCVEPFHYITLHFITLHFIPTHLKPTQPNHRHLKEVKHIVPEDRKRWIQDIKFDPTGEYIAVGTHDRFIDIYSSGDFKRTAVCKGHNSFITHIDWSECGDKIQANDGAYEMLFWDPEEGKQLLSCTEECAAEPWDSWTCVLGWPVFGIWEPGQMLCQINSVERTPAGDVLAVGDDNGRVKLFRYPCVTPGETKKGKYTAGARSKSYLGHSSHVCNVRWSFYEDTEDMSQKGTRLISVGGNDNTIIVWKRV